MNLLPQNSHNLASFFNMICKRWDELSDEEKASGEFINPNAPVVLVVPADYGDEENYLRFHVLSTGGDGEDYGHEGAELGGMEIEYRDE